MTKKNFIVGMALLLLGAGLYGFFHFQRRAKVADIISDEAAWDYRDSLAAATGMEVAFLPDGHVARILREDADTYLCEVQDTFTVRKSDVRVELWSAANGRGVVFLKHNGKFPAYSEPDSNSSIVAYLMAEDGYVPETYPCLGLCDGWFKIDVGGKTAYIETGFVIWDATDTF